MRTNLVAVVFAMLSLLLACENPTETPAESTDFDAPVGVLASDSTSVDGVMVEWDPAPGAQSYLVFRYDDETDSYAEIGNVEDTHYFDTSASDTGCQYYYKVKSYSATKGESAFSQYASGTIAPFLAPDGLQASYGEYAGRIQIDWDAVTGVGEYLVYRSDSLEGSYDSIGSASSSRFIDSSVTLVRDYYYRAASHSGKLGTSGLSDADSGYALQTYVVVRTWGSEGSGTGQFNNPSGIALDGRGNVYVCDCGENSRIQKFDTAGTFLMQISDSLDDTTVLDCPISAAVGPNSELLVADMPNNRIVVLDSAGQFVRKWGRLGENQGEFRNPVDVTVAGDGRVYVVDLGNNRIQVFDSVGTYLTEISDVFSYQPYRVVFGRGVTYVAVFPGDSTSVDLFDTEWNLLRRISEGQTCGIAVDPQGDLFLSGSGNPLQKLNTEFKTVAKIDPDEILPAQINHFEAIAVDTTGNVYGVDRYRHQVVQLRQQD